MPVAAPLCSFWKDALHPLPSSTQVSSPALLFGTEHSHRIGYAVDVTTQMQAKKIKCLQSVL